MGDWFWVDCPGCPLDGAVGFADGAAPAIGRTIWMSFPIGYVSAPGFFQPAFESWVPMAFLRPAPGPDVLANSDLETWLAMTLGPDAWVKASVELTDTGQLQVTTRPDHKVMHFPSIVPA